MAFTCAQKDHIGAIGVHTSFVFTIPISRSYNIYLARRIVSYSFRGKGGSKRSFDLFPFIVILKHGFSFVSSDARLIMNWDDQLCRSGYLLDPFPVSETTLRRCEATKTGNGDQQTASWKQAMESRLTGNQKGPLLFFR